MKKCFSRPLLLAAGVAVLFLISCLCTNASYAAMIKPDGEIENLLSQGEIIEKANIAASEASYDFAQLPLLETKAALIYNDEANAYEWVVSHIVKNEAEPYLVTIIDAEEGAVISVSRTNYFELYDQWEAQRQLPHELWPLEDLIFFDELYRRSDYLPRYVLPAKTDISMEAAVQAARKALNNKFNVSDSALDQYECAATARLDIGNIRKWYVCFCVIDSPTQADVSYQVTLNAETGAILQCLSPALGENALPIAIESSNAYLEQVYQLFADNGGYSAWQLEAKRQWAELMPDGNLGTDSSEAEIDRYIAQTFGKGNPQTVSIYNVFEGEWGDDFFWTLEQRAQFSAWTVQYFSNAQWDMSLCYVPGSEVISPADAVKAAWKAVSAAENLPPVLSDTGYVYSVSYGVERIYAADYPSYYTITFGIPLSEKDDQREPVTPCFQCAISSLGEVIDSRYSLAAAAPEEMLDAPSDFYSLSYGEPFGAWDLAQKADFSAEWKPYMDEYMKSHPNYRGFYYYETLYAYGLPAVNDLPQEQATEIAEAAAKRIGASEDYLTRADAHFYFDVSNPNAPLWKVYFSTLFSANVRYQDALGYFIVISSKSGDVLDAALYEQGKALESFR